MDEAAARRLVARESPGLSVQGCRFDKCSVATENYVRVWKAWTTTHLIEGVLISFEAQEKILRISWMRRP